MTAQTQEHDHPQTRGRIVHSIPLIAHWQSFPGTNNTAHSRFGIHINGAVIGWNLSNDSMVPFLGAI